MSNQTFTTIPASWTLVLSAETNSKYSMHFLATGMKIEFTMIPGQAFTIKDAASDVELTIDDMEPALPGGGLQLVPAPTLQ